MVHFSPGLQTVFRALTKNGASLLLTAAFVLVVTFLFGVIALAFFQADFEDGSSQCFDLFSCWLTMTYALRRGDLQDAVLTRQPYDPLAKWQVAASLPGSR